MSILDKIREIPGRKEKLKWEGTFLITWNY